MVTVADTSFLFALYANDVHSTRALEWLRATDAPIYTTELGEFELANAIRFAEFRRILPPGLGSVIWSRYEADRAAGRIMLGAFDPRSMLVEAHRLSASHTIARGHRSFDILHVAAALKLRAETFLTFDANQARLAKAEGLNAPL